MDAFDLAVAEVVEQGSDAWKEIRLGRFTSSEWNRLMTPGSRDMTDKELADRPKKGKGSRTTTIDDYSILSEGALTYIEEKVSEVLTGESEFDAYAYAKEYGREMEPVAVEYFEKKTGLTCVPAPFVPVGDHAGGSPDRFIVEENAGLEVKCPVKGKNQLKYLGLKDQLDLLEQFPVHYWQCMTNMFFTKRDQWHFVTFHPAMKVEKLKMVHIIVNPVPTHYDRISKALELAVTRKLQRLNELTK